MGKDGKSKENKDLSQLGNVDQIREILFGSQARELKERFEKLEENIKNMQDEMRSKMEQTQNDFNDRMNQELETLSRKMKNMSNQQSDEFADMRDSSLKLEKRIQNSLDMLADDLHAKNDQLQKQQIENRNVLRSQIDSLHDELAAVIEKKVSELGTAKLSREDAADILMEAAMAMKGTSLNQELAIDQEL